VELDVSPEGAEVSVDGQVVGTAPVDAPLVLAAGEHRFTAAREGYGERTVTRHLEGGCPGEALAISLTPLRGAEGHGPGSRGLVPPVPAVEPERRITSTAVGGWIVLALAGLSGIAASVTGGFALSLHQEFTQTSMTDDRWHGLRDDGRSLALATDIVLGIAGAAAAVCIPLLVSGYRSAGDRR
jgi:hypothetical protein